MIPVQFFSSVMIPVQFFLQLWYPFTFASVIIPVHFCFSCDTRSVFLELWYPFSVSSVIILVQFFFSYNTRSLFLQLWYPCSFSSVIIPVHFFFSYVTRVVFLQLWHPFSIQSDINCFQPLNQRNIVKVLTVFHLQATLILVFWISFYTSYASQIWECVYLSIEYSSNLYIEVNWIATFNGIL